MAQALDYLNSQFNVLSEDFLPKPQHLVPLTYLFSQVNRVTREQGIVIRKWFWRTAFSDRYSSGTDKKMDEDIEFFNVIIKKDYTHINRYQSAISEIFFSKHHFTKSNSYVKAFILMLSQKKPKDLTNGHYINTGISLSHYNRKEYHHIFPRSFLKEILNLESKANLIANFCFLPSDSNKRISDQAPSMYFFSEIPQESYDEILKSNLLPLNPHI